MLLGESLGQLELRHEHKRLSDSEERDEPVVLSHVATAGVHDVLGVGDRVEEDVAADLPRHCAVSQHVQESRLTAA